MKSKKYIKNLNENTKYENDETTSFDWDEFAQRLFDEFGSSHMTEYGDENKPYDYWLMDVTVQDIVDFVRDYKKDV